MRNQLKKLKAKSILQRVENAIIQLEKAEQLEEVPNVKKLKGYTHYYRFKLGDYRMGFELTEKETVKLIIVLHRKDIYKKFP